MSLSQILGNVSDCKPPSISHCRQSIFKDLKNPAKKIDNDKRNQNNLAKKRKTGLEGFFEPKKTLKNE